MILENEARPAMIASYICYEQHYKNENPFHLFDEDKVGWIDHTTIPHTLAGAMINITRPWPDQRSVRIADPFSGSGTFWLEAIKLPKTKVYCSDLNPAAGVMTADNLSFFRASQKQLAAWKQMLSGVGTLQENAKRSTSSYGPLLNAAIAACKKWQTVYQRDDYSSQGTILIKQLPDLDRRLLFYTVLKTTRRHNVEIDKDPWWAFFREA